MRLAACALSAVLLSGCSWLGMGGGYGDVYGYDNYGTQGQSSYNQSAYNQGHMSYGQGQMGYGQGQSAYNAGCAAPQAPMVVAAPGCGPGQGYSVASAGQQGMSNAYGGAGGQFGAVGSSAGHYGAGSAGQYGAAAGQYGSGMYAGAQGATLLSSQAPYGAAAGGQYGGVQTIQGSPVYMSGPAGSYGGAHMGLRGPYGAGCCGGNSGAMPYGLEASIGTEFDVSGDIFTAKDPGLALGSATVNTGGSDGITYGDAFGQMKSIGGTLGYDVSRSTTLHAGVNYSTANGKVAEGYQSVDARSPGTFEDIDAEFSDLDLWTIEGGIRKYMGHNPGFRPYIGASAGMTHNNSVEMHRTYSSDGVDYDPAPFEYVESGWNATAATTLGAEMAVSARAAIGVETGIRWRNNMNTIIESQDRWSVPVQLRGRVSF